MSQDDDIAHRYELGRKAGLSHETATDLAQPSDGVKRRPLSGEDWPAQMEAPAPGTDTTSYQTKEELTVDGAMWLRKLGIALSIHPLNYMAWRIGCLFASKGYPLIENVRVRGTEKDRGFVNLDMRVRYQDGVTRYKSLRVPVGVCNAHDTTWVIAHLLEYLVGSRVDLAFFKDLTMHETDLRHVHGAH